MDTTATTTPYIWHASAACTSFPSCGAMRLCTSPILVPMRGEVPGASMATRWITTASRCMTSKRRPGRDTSKTRLYQMQVLHKEFAQPLNVVIIAKTNLRTEACAHVVRFSSDLALAYASLVDYYGLRFQIEFNFRDAKQSWGLEDFMNVTPTGVTNAAHLSLFMVNVAYRLRADSHLPDPDYSVLDLKADCRGAKYVEKTIKLLPEKPEPILLAKILNQVTSLGRIHAARPAFGFS